jgi:hypothetical protein
MLGLLNFSLLWHVNVRGEIDVSSRGEWSKKHAPAKAGVRPARPQPF